MGILESVTPETPFSEFQPYADPRYWGWDGSVQTVEGWVQDIPQNAPPKISWRILRASLRAGALVDNYLRSMRTYSPTERLGSGDFFEASEYPAGTIVLASVENIDYGDPPHGFVDTGPIEDVPEQASELRLPLSDDNRGTSMRFGGTYYSRTFFMGVVMTVGNDVFVPGSILTRKMGKTRTVGRTPLQLPSISSVGQEYRNTPRGKKILALSRINVLGISSPDGA